MRRIAFVFILVIVLLMVVQAAAALPALADYAQQYDAGRHPALFSEWSGLELMERGS